MGQSRVQNVKNKTLCSDKLNCLYISNKYQANEQCFDPTILCYQNGHFTLPALLLCQHHQTPKIQINFRLYYARTRDGLGEKSGPGVSVIDRPTPHPPGQIHLVPPPTPPAAPRVHGTSGTSYNTPM